MKPRLLLRLTALLVGLALACGLIGVLVALAWGTGSFSIQWGAAAAGVLALLALVAAAGMALKQCLWHPLSRITSATRLIAQANADHRVPALQSDELGSLVDAINSLAQGYAQATTAIEPRLAQATAAAQAEKQRLAAIVAQLSQSVIVCNAAGQIVLFNDSARRVLDAPNNARATPMALGRSIDTILDHALIEHALFSSNGGTHTGSGGFITTAPSGCLVRVRAATLDAWKDADAQAKPGFMLSLEDMTRPLEAAQRADSALQALIRVGRAATANVRTAAETLIDIPELDTAQRLQLLTIIADEAKALGSQIARAEAASPESLETQWSLEPIRAADLLAAAAQRIRSKLGIHVDVQDDGLVRWLRVESFALVQSLSYLASRLKYLLDVPAIRLRASTIDKLVGFEILWEGLPLTPETWQQWETQPLRMGGEASARSLHFVMNRQGGEAWYQPPGKDDYPCLRLLLPAAPLNESGQAVAPQRPVAMTLDNATDEQDHIARLDQAVWTVFAADLGLDDEAQAQLSTLSAQRVVAGHALADAALAPPDGVASSIQLQQSLARFGSGTLLIAHNCAEVAQVLRTDEAASGTRLVHTLIDLRVLLDLAHVPSDSLDAAAAQLGLLVVGTDVAARAQLSADIVVKLIALLAANGVTEVAQLRAAMGDKPSGA